MKDRLENIDKIFKEKFDRFEANVKPSVWSNVQNSITSSASSSTVSGFAGKAILLKIAAGFITVGAIVTGAYFAPVIFGDEETSDVKQHIIVNAVPEHQNKIVLEITKEQLVEKNVKEEVRDEEMTQIKERISINAELAPANDTHRTANIVADDQQGEIVEAPVPIILPAREVVQEAHDPKNNVVDNVEEVINLSVNINVDNNKGRAPFTVQFNAWGEGTESYIWDFRDGSDKVSEGGPIHIFQKEGIYRVVLTGVDKNGHTKKASTTIIVEKNYSSFLQRLPNVFSPNGDGVNDFIKVRGENIDRVQIQINDRSGRPVYFMDSLEDVWDGKDQSGNNLVQGQYFMTVVAFGNDGQKHVKKQVINLRE